MANPVVHFEVVGKDADALQGFYKDLFGWSVNPAGDGVPYGLVESGGEGGIAGGIGATPDGSAYVTFYVLVDDLQTALDKAESLGGSTVMAPMEVPGGGKIAQFSDPDGNMVGLFKGEG